MAKTPSPSPAPRAFTAEEMRAKFLNYIIHMIGYWNSEGTSNVAKDMPTRDRMEGLIHSLLVLFDGGTGGMGAFDIACAPHSADKKYHKDLGENWVPPGVVINDCQLHDEFWSVIARNRKGQTFSQEEKTMPTKTKSTEPAKSVPVQEQLGKCYISKLASAKLNGDDGMGESFWVSLLTENTAEVRNNCMCGLAVGDIIEFKSYKDDGVHHPREFVKVVERKSQLYGLRYTFEGIEEVTNKMPKNVQDFLWKIEKKGCRFEGMVKGMAAVSRPNTMTEDEFFEFINSGPITFIVPE